MRFPASAEGRPSSRKDDLPRLHNPLGLLDQGREVRKQASQEKRGEEKGGERRGRERRGGEGRKGIANFSQ